MNGVHAQILQMIYGLWFREGQELAFVLQLRRRVYREVAVVHFINHKIGGRRGGHTHVGHPQVGVGVVHVDDGSTSAVHSHSLGKHAGCLVHQFFLGLHLKGVEHAIKVALDVCRPQVFARAFHLHGLHFLATRSLGIEIYLYTFGIRGRIELEMRHGFGVSQFVECLLGSHGHRRCQHQGNQCFLHGYFHPVHVSLW